MRHIFIINPAAGKRNCTAELMEMAKAQVGTLQLTEEDKAKYGLS